MSRLLLIACLIFAVASVMLWRWQESSAAPQDQTPSAKRPQDSDAVSRRDFMRTKLMYTQNIFEGLTTGDFDAIKIGVRNLSMVTEGALWVAIENADYTRLSDEFKTATRRLMTAAETGNIESTALRFYELSTSCIDCHQHIRKARYDL